MGALTVCCESHSGGKS